MATNTKKAAQVETPEVTEAAAETAEAVKVYKFVSKNKYLTCAALGVQFMNGKAETTSLEVAKALAKLSGVTMVED